MLCHARHHGKRVPGRFPLRRRISRTDIESSTRKPATATSRPWDTAAQRKKTIKRHAVKACLVLWARMFSAERKEPRVNSKPDGVIYCSDTALSISLPSPALHRFNEFLLFLTAFSGFVKPGPDFSISESETAETVLGIYCIWYKKRANRNAIRQRKGCGIKI